MLNRRKYRIKWFKLITIALSSYFIYLYISQQVQLNAINHETESTRNELGKIQQINTALKEERTSLNDRRYIEKLAREELGLVRPGETPYTITEKK